MIDHGNLWPHKGKQMPLWFIYYLTWSGDGRRKHQGNQPPRVKLSCKPTSFFSWTWLRMKNQPMLSVPTWYHSGIAHRSGSTWSSRTSLRAAENSTTTRSFGRSHSHSHTAHITSPRDSATHRQSRWGERFSECQEIPNFGWVNAQRLQMFEFGQSAYKKTTFQQSSPQVAAKMFWHKMFLYVFMISFYAALYPIWDPTDRIIRQK